MNTDGTSAAHYWRNVADLADVCIAEAITRSNLHASDLAEYAHDSGNGLADDASDYVSEVCDGNYWTIYTHAARACLMHTAHEDEIFEQGLFESCAFDSMAALYSYAASLALDADVRDALTDALDRWREANPRPEAPEAPEETTEGEVAS